MTAISIDTLQENVRHNEKNIDKLDRDLRDFRAEVNNRFEQLDKKIDNRFEQLDKKFEQSDKKFVYMVRNLR